MCIRDRPSGWQAVEIAFPANENGKNEYTAASFDAGFKLHMALPEGWRVSQPTEENLAQSTAQRPAAEDINTCLLYTSRCV